MSDAFAAMMNSFDNDEDKGGVGAMLELDLTHAPDSALAHSIAQICQGVVGSLVSSGYFKNLMEQEFRARATASSIDHTVYVDTRCTDLLNMIENHIEEFHSKPQIEEGSLEALREKVRTFKLLTEEKQ